MEIESLFLYLRDGQLKYFPLQSFYATKFFAGKALVLFFLPCLWFGYWISHPFQR